MDQTTITKLNQLNTHFYNAVAVDFDESRQYFWQGWEKIPPLLDNFKEIRIADIGCGNGRFGQFIFENCPQLTISYTGIDANETLLTTAQETLKGKIPALHLKKIDIVSALQSKTDFLANQTFHLVTGFGLFHHIPSFELRLQLLRYLLSKLSDNGFLIISFWQFMQFERFKKKIVTDQSVLEQFQIQPMKLEKNDYILNWLRGLRALRYCHFTDSSEQTDLIKQAGATQIKTYFADGKENTVNQYVVLTR